MNNFSSRFGAFETAGFGTFSSSELGVLGAPSRSRKKGVSDSAHAKLLQKYPWLRDENRQLKLAFDKRLPKQAKVIFRKLARMRDRLRKKALNALEGRTTGQVAGRVAVGYVTMGVSELARLIAKKPLAKARRARSLKILAKADACDMLLRYWAGKFRGHVADLRKKAKKSPSFAAELRAAETAVAAVDSVEADGATEGMATEPGDVDADAALARADADEPDASESAPDASESAPDSDEMGFLGLTGREVFTYGALGALAGLALS